MSMLEKIKKLFSNVPEETRAIIAEKDTPDEVLRKLDEMLTKNEIQAKILDKEITKLEELEQENMGRVKDGDLPERQKRNLLREIKRLRLKMDAYDHRLKIFERNMNLHLNLMSKISDIQAMEMRGVSEDQIDKIIMEFDENLESYMSTMYAGEAIAESHGTVSDAEERELAALEKEIMGDTHSPEPELESEGPGEPGEPEEPIEEKRIPLAKAMEKKPKLRKTEPEEPVEPERELEVE